MFGSSKEIARFDEGNLSVSVHQDSRRLDEGDEWCLFHAAIRHPSGEITLGEGLVNSLSHLCYQAKQKIADQREKIESEESVPA